jgi:hypothetical protein
VEAAVPGKETYSICDTLSGHTKVLLLLVLLMLLVLWLWLLLILFPPNRPRHPFVRQNGGGPASFQSRANVLMSTKGIPARGVTYKTVPAHTPEKERVSISFSLMP